jgi:hypothetical protein
VDGKEIPECLSPPELKNISSGSHDITTAIPSFYDVNLLYRVLSALLVSPYWLDDSSMEFQLL